jgi:ribokinase
MRETSGDPSALESQTPDVLVCGSATTDVFEGRTAAGGAVRFAARVVEAFGATAALVVLTARHGDDVALSGEECQFVDGGAPLVFAHRLDDSGGRSLCVLSRPRRPLDASVIPVAWREPALLVLAPLLADDMNLDSFAALPPNRERLLLAQGLLRDVNEAGDVRPVPEAPDALLKLATPDMTVALSEEETADWPTAALAELAARSRRLIVTRGADGADVITSRRLFHVQPVAARVVDSTGAGDTFATAFACALALGVTADEREAGTIAAAAAAASIEQTGPASLPPLAALRLRAKRSVGAEDSGAVA